MTETNNNKDIDIDFGNGKTDKLPIKIFSFDKIAADPTIVMIAKRGSGKSWVVRALLYYFRKIPVGLIIAPTDKMSCFYGKFYPDSYIHYEYKSEIITRVLCRQGIIIDKSKVKKVDPRCIVVMDDCLGQRGSWVKDQPIQELLFNGRHYKIIYILTMQFPLGITPELRSNFDYIFLMNDDFTSNVKRMYDHYAGMFPTFDSFRQIFGQLTDNYGAMVIANRREQKKDGSRSSLFDKIFWYKAPNLEGEDIKFGCNQFRRYHEKNYNKNWRDKTKHKIDVNDYFLKKKQGKSLVVVNKVGKKPEENQNEYY